MIPGVRAAAIDTGAEPTEENSPFTSALLKHLPTPNLELHRLLVRVHNEVATDTNGRQNPRADDGLIAEEFYFNAPRQ
jgi:hypothetical protein